MNKTTKSIIVFALMFLLAWGIYSYVYKNEEFVAIYFLGGDSGTLPYSKSIILELEPSKNQLSSLSVSGRISSMNSCDIWCTNRVYTAPRWDCPSGCGETCDCPSCSCQCARNCVSIYTSGLNFYVDGVFAGTTSLNADGSFSSPDLSQIVNSVHSTQLLSGSCTQPNKCTISVEVKPTGQGGQVSNFNVRGGEETCAVNYVCEEWSECDGIKQVRACSDSRCEQPVYIEQKSCSWECSADADCKTCFATCTNHNCVSSSGSYPSSPCDGAVWNDYPTCAWDSLNCVTVPPVEIPSETTENYLWLYITLGFIVLIFLIYFIKKKVS